MHTYLLEGVPKTIGVWLLLYKAKQSKHLVLEKYPVELQVITLSSSSSSSSASS